MKPPYKIDAWALIGKDGSFIGQAVFFDRAQAEEEADSFNANDYEMPPGVLPVSVQACEVVYRGGRSANPSSLWTLISEVLEKHSSKCLDTPRERSMVTRALVERLSRVHVPPASLANIMVGRSTVTASGRGAIGKLPSRRRRNPNGAEVYETLHWGDRGNRRVTSTAAPDPSIKPIVCLGELREVGYLTTKGGDPKDTIYEHAFKRPYPRLCVNGEGGLIVVGGGYRVEERGIVG